MNNFCSSCGGNLIAGGTHCPNCGAPVTQISDNNNANVNMQQPMMNNQNMGMQNPNQMMPNNGMNVMGQPMNNTGEVWKNKNARNAIILEIISFFAFGWLAAVGLGLALKGLQESKEHNGTGQTLSIVGIVIGILFTIFYVIAVVNN